MTKVTQAKQVKHGTKLNGRRIIAWKKDGSDSFTGVYHTQKDSNVFYVNSSGTVFALIRDNWTIEEIVETEE